MSFGFAISSLDRHIHRFIIVASANQLPKRFHLSTFLSALIDVAADWYAQILAIYTNQNALRNALLGRFFP